MSLTVPQAIPIEGRLVAPRRSWGDRATGWNRRILLAGVFLGVAARIIGLGSKSLWFDEAVSARYLDFSLPEILRSCADMRSAHPPLYFLLLRLWSMVWGTSDVALRALATLFGILTILGTYGLVRTSCRLSSSWSKVAGPAALLAAALVSLSPLQIQLSQQVRGYTLGTALYVWGGWALIHAALAPVWRGTGWVFYALLALGLCYTHNLGPLLVGTQMIWIGLLLVARCGARIPGLSVPAPDSGAESVDSQVRLSLIKGMVLVSLILMVGYVIPWGPRLLGQSDTLRHGFSMPITLQDTVNNLFRAFFATFDSDPNPDATGAWIVTCGVGLVLVYLGVRGGLFGVYLFLNGVVPVLVMVGFSLVSNRTLLMPRYLGFTQVIWLIGIGVAAGGIRYPIERMMMSLWVVAWAVFACYDSRDIIGPSANPGMRAAIGHVLAHRASGEPIVSRSPFTFFGAVHYARGRAAPRLCVNERDLDRQRGAECLRVDDLVTPEMLMADGCPGIWFVSSNSYLTQLIVNFPAPDNWKRESIWRFDQDRFYEHPVIVEHYLVDRSAARTPASEGASSGRRGPAEHTESP